MISAVRKTPRQIMTPAVEVAAAGAGLRPKIPSTISASKRIHHENAAEHEVELLFFVSCSFWQA
jgi:hypothetical protein